MFKITKIHTGYLVAVNDSFYFVYRTDGLWFAKNKATGVVVDAAPTKAQLIRSLEAV